MHMLLLHSSYEKFSVSWEQEKAAEHRKVFSSNGRCFLTAIKEFLLYELVAFILAFNFIYFITLNFSSCCLSASFELNLLFTE